MRTRLKMGQLVAAWPSCKPHETSPKEQQHDCNNNNIQTECNGFPIDEQDKSMKQKTRINNNKKDKKINEAKMVLICKEQEGSFEISKGSDGNNFMNNDRSLENMAPKFKYVENECLQDICLIRDCLRQERDKQTSELQLFYNAEFKRLMEDDWLVTRFLLRGSKEAARNKQANKQINNDQQQQQQQTITTESIATRNKTIVNLQDLSMRHKETLKLIEACAQFKLKYQMGSELKLSDFPLLWTKREGILVHGLDRCGNACIYLRCQLHKPKLIDQAESRFHFKRLLLFHLNECDLKLFNREGHAICCIFDMSSVSLENLDLELIAWMVSSFKHCSPKLLAYVIVYNLPWLFNATFRLLTQNLLSRSHQQSLRFVYSNELLHYINANQLPVYLQEKLKV